MKMQRILELAGVAPSKAVLHEQHDDEGYLEDTEDPMDVEDLEALAEQVYGFYEQIKKANVLSAKETKDVEYWLRQYTRAFDAGNSETTDEAITQAGHILATANRKYGLRLQVPDYIADLM